jgi:hypothetical protein
MNRDKTIVSTNTYVQVLVNLYNQATYILLDSQDPSKIWPINESIGLLSKLDGARFIQAAYEVCVKLEAIQGVYCWPVRDSLQELVREIGVKPCDVPRYSKVLWGQKEYIVRGKTERHLLLLSSNGEDEVPFDSRDRIVLF